MTQELATRDANAITWESSHGEMSITLEECRAYFCKTATDNELMLFLKLCQYQHLNPFLKEAYLVKYGTGEKAEASIIVGKEVYTKRAMTIDDCEGFEAGIVVARPSADGDPVMTHIEGAMKLPGDILIGGYSKVRSKSRGESYHAVALEEYIGTTAEGRPTKFWSKMPATMIRKVALVQGLREMYPADFQGLYDATEMDAVPNAIDSTSRVVPDGTTRVPGAGINNGNFATSDGPDLGDCPVHNRPWIVSADKHKRDYWNGAHPGEEGGPWCRLKDVYLTLTQDAFAVKTGNDFDQKLFNGWLKKRMGGTWSVLSDERKLEAYNRCRVDESTGVIDPAPDAQRAADDAAAEEGAANHDREVSEARSKVTDPEVAAMFDRGTNGPAEEKPFEMSDEEKNKAEGKPADDQEADDVDIPF